MASFLYKFLQSCCKFGYYFMSVWKIVDRSPGSHDKVIYMILFCYAHKHKQVWKLPDMAEPKISSRVLILCIICNLYPGYMKVMITI